MVIRAFVFDLCDTLVRTAGIAKLQEVPGITSGEEVERWLRSSPLFPAYERGELDSEVFLGALRADLGLRLSTRELGAAFAGLILHEIEGMAQLLHALHPAYPLYALSNNNPLLWRGIQQVSPSIHLFSRIFLSQETGLLKPDPRAFGHVLEQIGLPAREVVLVDDNPACVEQARALGLHALLFTETGALRRELEVLTGGVLVEFGTEI